MKQLPSNITTFQKNKNIMNYVSLHFVFKTPRSDFSALFGALSFSYLALTKRTTANDLTVKKN
jgi:type IV secretory pathway VirB3-like protein